MSEKRGRVLPKNEIVRERLTSAPTRRRTLFGEPLLLPEEDRALYDELYDRVHEAAKPTDSIDEMFVSEFVARQWEVLRWRRCKWSWVQARAFEVLVDFLDENLDYDSYLETFADELAEILRDTLPADQANVAHTLAQKCARNEKDAVDRVKKVLTAAELDADPILDRARRQRAEELARDFVGRDPDARALVHVLFTAAGASMDALTAKATSGNFEYLERVERQITIAETWRDANLHQIERRKTVLGETLRRTAQQIDELEVIEAAPAKGKRRLDEQP